MSRVVRSPFIAVVVATFAVVLLARSAAPLQGQGQPSPPTSAQVAPFVGDWLVTIAFMANEATLRGRGEDRRRQGVGDGQLRRTADVNVTDISLAGNRLVLKYMTAAMGTPISTVLTLTPEGQVLRANMAVMDGQYQMSGTGAKQAPGAPVRASGIRRRRARFSDERRDRLLAEASLSSAHAGRGSRRIHPAGGLPHGARRRRARRDQPGASSSSTATAACTSAR